MSRKRQTRNKAYNPQKSKKKMLRNRAARCGLTRWESASDAYGVLEAQGPFSPQKNASLMEWAMGQSERWLCAVIACFSPGRGEYYEEMVTLPVLGPLKLGDQAAEVDPLVAEAMEDAKRSGNPSHHIDTVVSFRLHTPQLSRDIEDEDWIREQARIRADIVFADYDNQELAQLLSQRPQPGEQNGLSQHSQS